MIPKSCSRKQSHKVGLRSPRSARRATAIQGAHLISQLQILISAIIAFANA